MFIAWGVYFWILKFTKPLPVAMSFTPRVDGGLCPISVREILITAPRIQLTKRAPNSISIALARTLHIVLNLT